MFDVMQRISAFEKLGRFISQYNEKRDDEDLAKLNEFFLDGFRESITLAGQYNNWFTADNLEFALDQWSQALTGPNLEKWVSNYSTDHFENDGQKTIAIIMAGNIPMVGFHDLISVLMSGHKVLVKPSSDDDKLIPFLSQVLVAIDREFAGRITFADGQLKGFDAIIATGSNNSARYFDYYFGKYPNIIRKNRTSVAVIDGNESEEDLKKLGEDVFRYFGLGCRNVSKLYLPENYDLDKLFGAFYDFKDVVNNKSYGNNYDYNRAISMMEKHDFLENGFMQLKRNASFHAPVSVVHYANYSSLDAVLNELKEHTDELQCIVSTNAAIKNSIPFGTTQMPQLWDYADNVDTIKFLRSV